MKSLLSSLALAASLGLCSVALADGGCSSCGGCGQADSCCGHGLLSKLRLHRCNECCEAPRPSPVPCDPCAGHKLVGWIRNCHLPKFGGGCGGGCGSSCGGSSCGTCNTCETPKCCRAPRVVMPKMHCSSCSSPCDSCGGGHLSGLRNLLHRDSCCSAPAPSCGSCNSCGGHGLNLHGLFGKRCGGGCDTGCSSCANGTTTEAPSSSAPAPIPAPAPAPKPSASSNNGLLILTPAG